jgi:hypothetical protein
MAFVQNLSWGLAGAATTMAVRSATRAALHRDNGTPRLPRATRRNPTFGMMLLLAATAGVVLAFADVVLEQRKRVTRLAA